MSANLSEIQAHGQAPSVDARIAAIASAQRDLITIAQLLGVGLTDGAVTHRVARGALHRRHRGVYSLGGAPLSPEAEHLAAVLACGPGSAIRSRSAARLFEVSRFPAPLIEVVSPRRRKVAGAGVHHCRSLIPRDVTDLDGIPITTVHRMFVDLSDVLTPHQLANVIHEAAYRGRYVEAAIRDVMERMNGRHKLAVLERAMELHRMGSAGTRSGAEDAFLRLDLPEPLVNMHLLDREVDFHWPDRGRGRRDPRAAVERGRRFRPRRDTRRRGLHGPAFQRPRCLRARERGDRSNRRGAGGRPRTSACGSSTPRLLEVPRACRRPPESSRGSRRRCS